MRAAIVLAVLSFIASPALAQQSAPTEAGGGESAEGSADLPTDAEGNIVFRSIVGDEPIELGDDPGETVQEFRRTGVNPYADDETAIAEGRKLYLRLCQACHLPDGSGRIGPSLRDDEWRDPRLETEVGRFEIIHSGGAGAMQAFSHRMDADEILKVMAYMDTFRESETSN